MSLSSAKGTISDAEKQLMVQWGRANEQWSDGVADAWFRRYIEPVEGRVRTTLMAMDELMTACDAAKRACG